MKSVFLCGNVPPLVPDQISLSFGIVDSWPFSFAYSEIGCANFCSTVTWRRRFVVSLLMDSCFSRESCKIFHRFRVCLDVIGFVMITLLVLIGPNLALSQCTNMRKICIFGSGFVQVKCKFSLGKEDKQCDLEFEIVTI
jgi:hypothetical protein